MATFSVEKSIVIDAPCERVFEEVRDFRKWPSWSPWLLAEPESRLQYSEDGKSYSWEGKIVGAGEVEVLEESPPNRMHCRLTFLKPWKSESTTTFELRDTGNGTEVTWKMNGSLPFFLAWMKKTMTAFIGMDYMRGLTMMKEKVETGKIGFRLATGKSSVEGFSYIGASNECDVANIGPSMSSDFTKLKDFFGESGVCPSGHCFAIYHKWDPVKNICHYTCGFQVSELPAEVGSGLVTGSVPGHQAYTVTLTGPYSHLTDAWTVGMMHERAKVFSQDKSIDSFEIYENDPAEVPEKELVTVVHIPMKG